MAHLRHKQIVGSIVLMFVVRCPALICLLDGLFQGVKITKASTAPVNHRNVTRTSTHTRDEDAILLNPSHFGFFLHPQGEHILWGPELGEDDGEEDSFPPPPYRPTLPFPTPSTEDVHSHEKDSEQAMFTSHGWQERMHFVLPRPAPAGSVVLSPQTVASAKNADVMANEQQEEPAKNSGTEHGKQDPVTEITAERRGVEAGDARGGEQQAVDTADNSHAEEGRGVDSIRRGGSMKEKHKEHEPPFVEQQKSTGSNLNDTVDISIKKNSMRASAAPRDTQGDIEGTRGAAAGSFVDRSGLDKSSLAAEYDLSATAENASRSGSGGQPATEKGHKEHRSGGDDAQAVYVQDENGRREKSFLNPAGEDNDSDSGQQARDEHDNSFSLREKREQEEAETGRKPGTSDDSEASRQSPNGEWPSAMAGGGGQRSITDPKEIYKSVKRFPAVVEESVPPSHPALGSPFVALHLFMRVGSAHLSSLP